MRYLPIILLTSIGAAACNPFGPKPEEKIARACENVLKERLKAPTTYKRLKATNVTKSVATLEQYLGWYTPEMVAREKKALKRNVHMREINESQIELFNVGKRLIYEIYIEYTASNSYGTPIRNAARCNLVTPYSTLENAAKDDVEKLSWKVDVNGFNRLSWSREIRRRSKERAR